MVDTGSIKGSFQRYDITVSRASPYPLYTYAALVGDSSCVSQWKFELAGLLADSKGDNDFIEIDSGNYERDAATYKEGSSSISIDNTSVNNAIELTDADLSDNFPLKYDKTNTSISACFWAKVIQWNSFNGLAAILWKGTTGKFSIAITFWASGSNVYFTLRVGKAGGTNWSVYTAATALSLNQWYHVSIACDLTSYKIRIWDDVALEVIETKTGENLEMPITDEDIKMDAGGAGAGPTIFKVDNLIVFDRVLISDEMDLIRAEHASS